MTIKEYCRLTWPPWIAVAAVTVLGYVIGAPVFTIPLITCVTAWVSARLRMRQFLRRDRRLDAGSP